MWNCKYHIVFAPKYRRKEIYGKLRKDIGEILRELCNRKEIEIIKAELCIDHVHMLLSIPPKYSISQIMGYLKGKSSLIIFDRHANLKYKCGSLLSFDGGLFQINEVSLFIVKSINDGLSKDEIMRDLATIYNQPLDVIEQDVSEFYALLKKYGIL